MTDSAEPREAALRILIVEDSEDDAELMERALRRDGLDFVAERVESEAQLVASVGRTRPHIVLCDFHMPRLTCRHVLEILAPLDRRPPVLVVSRHISDEEAATVLGQGAHGVVRKSRIGELALQVRLLTGGETR